MGETAPLSRDQRRALAHLSPIAKERGLYLAGGVAVALHRGHRQSLDLDLFSLRPNLDLAALRDSLAAADPTVEVLSLTDATLRAKIGTTPVDVVSYPYPPLVKPRAGALGLAVAAPRDLAAMKLAAVAQRGIYRDFWDLHELLTHGISLRRALADYKKRYGAASSDVYHVLRALTYFDDAEAATRMPKGLTREHWKRIRSWFEREASRTLTAGTKRG